MLTLSRERLQNINEKKNDYKKKQVRDKKLNSSSGTWLKIKII